MPGKNTGGLKEARLEGLIAIAHDAEDGHQRITRMEDMVLVGGSAETHERMQETAIRFAEELEKRGKSLAETTIREAMVMLREAIKGAGR